MNLTSDPSLHTVPDTGHCRSVEDGPERAPNTERGPRDDGETDMVHGTNATRHADEAGSESIAEPDTEP